MGIILDFASSILWGILASTGAVVLAYFVLSSLIEVEKLRCWALCIVLWLLLAFQFTAWVGAAKASGYVDSVYGLLDREEVNGAIENVNDFIDEYPVLKPFIPQEIMGKKESLEAIVEAIKDTIFHYELRRAGWSAGFFVAALVGGCFMRRRRRRATALSPMGEYSTSSSSSGLRF